MRRVLTGLFAFVLLALIGTVVQQAYAAETLKFTTGEVLKHNLSVCLDKQDAIDIVKADVKGGLEAAHVVWAAKSKCGNADIVGGVVGLIVHQAQIKRGEETFTVSVVEILHNGEVAGYFLTTGKIEAKRDRNT